MRSGRKSNLAVRAPANVLPFRRPGEQAEEASGEHGDGDDGDVTTYTIQLTAQADEAIAFLTNTGMYGDSDEDVVTWAVYETLRRLFHKHG